MAELISIDAPLHVASQIEARAQDPTAAGREFLVEHGRSFSYRRFRDECVRVGHFLRSRLGPATSERPPHVAMMLENHFELLTLYGGCAYADATLFGLNTGLRGETLAGVVNQSRARMLVVDERFAEEIERIHSQLELLTPETIWVLHHGDGDTPANEWLAALELQEGAVDPARAAPAFDPDPERNLIVIYTSGTTGLPKGINNNHLKLLLIGARVAGQLGLDPTGTGYACMPLFHSNALFLGFHPAFHACGRLALRERFSASQFVPDVLEHGITFWNYVGEPVHYILGALEERFAGDEERILDEVAAHPLNRLRHAIGNGAAPPDIDRFERWLGLEDMYELYGSTEAAISTFRKRGDPRGSVGEITDPAVRILDEAGRECVPAELDADGKLSNYAEAVGEICRVADDTALFQGYYENDDADSSKYRDGVYHSGDLGHILERAGARFLFFDGRTDDWIRKDGENFSAAQVARLLMEHPDVTLAAAYGAPCAVSDELVMAALKLAPGFRFDPQAFFGWCEAQVEHGSMDRKWFPDFVRIVDEFQFTQTQKILVRDLKKDHFHRARLPDAPIYWRQRGDDQYRRFTDEAFAALRARFAAAERDALLG